MSKGLKMVLMGWSAVIVGGFLILKIMQVETLFLLWGIILVLSFLLFLGDSRGSRLFSSIRGDTAMDAYAIDDLEQREKQLRGKRAEVGNFSGTVLLLLIMPLLCLVLDYFVC